MFGFFEAIYSFLTRQIGLRTDAADPAGSLHAKVNEVSNNLVSKIGTSSDTRSSNTVMGWLNSQIKSIQRGVISLLQGETSASATITSVTTSKAVLIHLGQRTTTSTSVQHAEFTLTLDSSTTVTATRGALPGGESIDAYISFEVVEFY